MLFSEPSFLFLLLPLALALYVLIPARLTYLRNLWLLAVSLVFYAWGVKQFIFVILGATVFNYGAALAVGRYRTASHGRIVLALAITANLALLGWFKYAGFLGRTVNALTQTLGLGVLSVPHVVVPLGISFFTFHAISYVVDVYRQDATAQKHPVQAALYLLLFPRLLAGPIIRYRQIADQLARRPLAAQDVAYGIRRFVIGLGKKMLIANSVAGVADRIFAVPPRELGPDEAWLGIVCYTVQIFFDFSGYTDMAVGLGAMFGFRFPENFDYPYVSKSIREFWRRWHMTLSAWFRDYLYIPMGGNRVTPRRVLGNLLTVFFLCGLWHGASWGFVIWGLYHGFFLVLERLGLDRRLERLWRPLQHGYALLVVMVGWVFFRADTLPHAVGYLGAMFGLSAPTGTCDTVGAFVNPVLVTALVAATLGSAPFIPWLLSRLQPQAPSRGATGVVLEAFTLIGLTLVFLASAACIAAGTYAPFIYHQF